MALLHERLVELRKNKGFTQKQLAEISNIPLRTYQRYEIGERQPVADIICKLADTFDVSADYLLGRTDKP